MRPVISSFSLAPLGPIPGDSSKAPDVAHHAEIAEDFPQDIKHALDSASQRLLADSLQGAARGNALLISHPALPLPDTSSLLSATNAFGLAIGLLKGEGQVATVIECATGALPFQDEAFRTIALYHVIADGTEPELAEACRVLAPGGELLVVGLNRNGWSANTLHRHGPLPHIRHGSLLGSLRRMDMEMVAELGIGLLGRAKPRMEHNSWSGLGLTFADLLLLRIRHRNRAIPSRPQLEKFPARAMPTSFVIG